MSTPLLSASTNTAAETFPVRKTSVPCPDHDPALCSRQMNQWTLAATHLPGESNIFMMTLANLKQNQKAAQNSQRVHRCYMAKREAELQNTQSTQTNRKKRRCDPILSLPATIEHFPVQTEHSSSSSASQQQIEITDPTETATVSLLHAHYVPVCPLSENHPAMQSTVLYLQTASTTSQGKIKNVLEPYKLVPPSIPVPFRNPLLELAGHPPTMFYLYHYAFMTPPTVEADYNNDSFVKLAAKLRNNISNSKRSHQNQLVWNPINGGSKQANMFTDPITSDLRQEFETLCRQDLSYLLTTPPVAVKRTGNQTAAVHTTVADINSLHMVAFKCVKAEAGHGNQIQHFDSSDFNGVYSVILYLNEESVSTRATTIPISARLHGGISDHSYRDAGKQAHWNDEFFCTVLSKRGARLWFAHDAKHAGSEVLKSFGTRYVIFALFSIYSHVQAPDARQILPWTWIQDVYDDVDPLGEENAAPRLVLANLVYHAHRNPTQHMSKAEAEVWAKTLVYVAEKLRDQKFTRNSEIAGKLAEFRHQLS